MKKRLLLPLIFIIVIILFIIFYNIISCRINLINKWEKIESSYEIVNELFIEYYNNHCDTECNKNSSILLYFSNLENKMDLSDEEKNAIYEIKDYYKHQDSVLIGKDEIVYGDDSGYFMIVYTRNGNKPSFDKRWDIDHIKNNWYRVIVNGGYPR